jgi:hypothetical protein
MVPVSAERRHEAKQFFNLRTLSQLEPIAGRLLALFCHEF